MFWPLDYSKKDARTIDDTSDFNDLVQRVEKNKKISLVAIFVDFQDVTKTCKIQQPGNDSDNGQSSGDDSDADSSDNSQVVVQFTPWRHLFIRY